MIATPVETTPTVLVLSAHTSFRAHVEKWLPPPAVNVVEAEVGNLESRAKELPPQLLIIDQQLENVGELLARAAVVMPGVPYLILTVEHLDPVNPYLFDISSGFVAKKDEFPTRESVLDAIRKVAPTISARLK